MKRALVLVATLAWAAPVRADDTTTEERHEERAVAPRPWLYLADPTLPEALHAVADVRATYTNRERPFVGNVGRTVAEASADVSLLDWLAVTGSAFGDGRSAGASGGIRVSLLPRASSTHLVLGAGGLRDLSGVGGVYGRATVQQDLGRARAAASIQGEHLIDPRRDAVDVMVSTGVSYAVVGPLRLGAEWVAQDLEGALDDEEAEGGVRSFLGPTASLELLQRNLAIVGGPSFGITPGSAPVAARLSIALSF